ncbi:hypothetical protein EXIGLDRAFT_755641 [Exidia glandulosa HHB12029]|uniref:RNase H type-1 domain-containing protein n=1 Tax=Exidia glandulosa HHB12029 TaxID=1314781 RepID=A0A165BVX5_EXIGL|nr:hypothetical protein EXIGLDRAFT_755641 [Exidia glandulosa HHB12029]
MQTLRKPKDQGGKNLLDIGSRNHAAYTVWLKDYLSDNTARPTWAYLADVILALNARVLDAQKTPLDARYNPFIQAWKPNNNKLPFILKSMMKVSKIYGIVADAPYVPEEVRLQVPIWSHFAREHPNVRQHTKEARCLRKNHHIYLVNGLDELAEADDPNHTAEEDCGCDNCKSDREEGCEFPSSCQAYAEDILADIAPKWSLNTIQPNEDLSLTRDQEAENEISLEVDEAVTFDPEQNQSQYLADYLRIFTNYLGINPDDPHIIAQREPGIREWHRPNPGAVHAYACGSCLHGKTANARGGWSIHFPNGESADETGATEGQIQTEERSAAYAVLRAALRAPNDKELHIVTNNKTVIKRLTTKRKAHEDVGWSDVPETADIFRRAIAALRSRATRTTLTHVSRHRTGWPEVTLTVSRAREAARAATRLEVHEEIDQGIIAFDVAGARLGAMTQRKAHRIIRQIKTSTTPSRRATLTEVERAKVAIEELNNRAPTDATVWKATKSKDLSRNVRNFLWKGLHGAHKVGEYFETMPSPWKELAICPRCECTESMEHILFHCTDPAQAAIWRLAQDALERKLDYRPDVDLGTVWGCGAALFEDEEKEVAAGKARAFQIVVSESAFLIWKIRCERRIQHEDDAAWTLSQTEIINRWQAVINMRISTDRLLTHKSRHKRGALGTQTVLHTWRGLLENEESLPQDWIRRPGCLVGIGTRRIWHPG